MEKIKLIRSRIWHCYGCHEQIRSVGAPLGWYTNDPRGRAFQRCYGCGPVVIAQVVEA